jgi:hypothetical protein
MAEAVTITILARGSAPVADLPEFAELLGSFSALIDAVDAAAPRRVPRRLVRALDRHREALVGLGELRLVTAAVKVT